MTCEQCGVVYEANNKRQRFCSDTCRWAWWSSGQSGTRVMVFRLHGGAAAQLTALAESEGSTVGEIMREALYATYGIDELAPPVGASLAAPRVIHPPRP